MIATWMVSATILGTVAALAAAAAASLLAGFRRQQRWSWCAALCVSVVVPLALALVRPATPLPAAADIGGRVAVIGSDLQLASAAVPVVSHSLDFLLLGAWGAASALLGLLLIVTWRRTSRQLSGLAERTLLDQSVTASAEFGPAVVGWLHPRVVVPLWVFELPEAEQQLVLRHETQHLRSRDQLVLLAGIGCVVAMPWNPALWWQLRRLRVAMEVDCDARVAVAPSERVRYGKLLVTAHEQRQLLGPLALTLRASGLGQRLQALLRPAVPTRVQVAGRAGALVACAAFGARIPVPHLQPMLTELVGQSVAPSRDRPAVAPPVAKAVVSVGRPEQSRPGDEPATHQVARRSTGDSRPAVVMTAPISTGLADLSDAPVAARQDVIAKLPDTSGRAVAGRGQNTAPFVPDSASGLAVSLITGGGRAGQARGGFGGGVGRGTLAGNSGNLQQLTTLRASGDSLSGTPGAVRASGPVGGRGGRAGPPPPEAGARLVPKGPEDTGTVRRFVTAKGDTIRVGGRVGSARPDSTSH